MGIPVVLYAPRPVSSDRWFPLAFRTFLTESEGSLMLRNFSDNVFDTGNSENLGYVEIVRLSRLEDSDLNNINSSNTHRILLVDWDTSWEDWRQTHSPLPP